MTGSTHFAGGLAAGAVYLDAVMYSAGTVGIKELGMCAAVLVSSAVGSLAPDIDLKTSKAGHAVRPVSAVAAMFGHRTFFHSPLILILIYFACASFIPADYSQIYISFIIGAVSHLFLDMLNRKGIPLLYPIPRRFHIASVKTGSRRETRLMILLYMLFAAAVTVFIVLTAPHISLKIA